MERTLSELLLQETLPNLLHAEGGVCGIRVTAEAHSLSSSAGAMLALALLKLTREAAPGSEPAETALRLADFCLKGQHPGGLFFETFDLKGRDWVGLRGSENLIDLPASAAVAGALLRAADELERLGLPGGKYRTAGRRALAAFVDPRGALKEAGGVMDLRAGAPAEGGLGALELAEPLLHLHRREGGTAWRKALAALARAHFPAGLQPLQLPAFRAGREPDSRAALLLLRTSLALREAGFATPGAASLPELLYPWVYLNRDGGAGPDGFDPVGGLLDSSRRSRLLFQGYEAAFLFWMTARDAADSAGRADAEELVRLLTRFTAQAPLGTAWYAHAPWGALAGRQASRRQPEGKGEAGRPRFGPVDGRRLAREALHLLRIREECPQLLSAVVLPAAGPRRAGLNPPAPSGYDRGRMRTLPRSFYLQDAVTVARALLGRCLVREGPEGRLVGRIVETEAYLPDDPASHSFRGPTRRNAAMFREGGIAYVYRLHTHHCLNVVTGPAGFAAAVLIRALEPLEGIEAMARRRFPEAEPGPLPPRLLRLLCAGPGRLCRAFGLTVEADDGRSLLEGELTIREAEGEAPPPAASGPRIGIRLAAERPWRFTVRGSPFLSRREGAGPGPGGPGAERGAGGGKTGPEEGP